MSAYYNFLVNKVKKIKLSNAGFLFIKVIIVVVAFWYIYNQLITKENLIDTWQTYQKLFTQDNTLYLLLLVFLLMFANWGMEAVKWKFMMAKIEDITFFRSMKAILSGVTVTFFTPNRIGEYLGRIFYLHKADKIQAVLITVFGSMSQLLITIILGLLSLPFFLIDEYHINQYFLYAIILIVALIIILCLLFFFNASVISFLLNKIKWLNKYRKYNDVFSLYSSKDLYKIFFFSLSRYIIFTLQFYILLQMSGISIGFIKSWQMISLTFLVMSVVPAIALAEIGVRGSVAIYFLGTVSNNTLVFVSTVSLWLINIVIPGLIGAVFILALRFRKS